MKVRIFFWGLLVLQRSWSRFFDFNGRPGRPGLSEERRLHTEAKMWACFVPYLNPPFCMKFTEEIGYLLACCFNHFCNMRRPFSFAWSRFMLGSILSKHMTIVMIHLICLCCTKWIIGQGLKLRMSSLISNTNHSTLDGKREERIRMLRLDTLTYSLRSSLFILNGITTLDTG